MSNRWLQATDAPRGAAYDAQFSALARTGQDVHGEATLVASLGGTSVLDAGCGTGRVAIELARRGYDVVGVDLDPDMLTAARQKAPHLPWHEGDIASFTFMTAGPDSTRRLFDAIVMAGNVMLFVVPGTEAAVIANLAGHLAPGGALIAGFQLVPGGLTLDTYDAFASQVGLTGVERWATWDRQPWQPTSPYAVSVHRRPSV